MVSEYVSFTLGGRCVRVRITGVGDTKVLCLHPLASSGRFWDPLACFLGDEATVFAPDLRGHGDAVWDGAPFTVPDMADDMAALITGALCGSVSVIGKSMGGCVALALAVRHPEMVKRLVLADTTASYGPERKEKWDSRAVKAVETSRADQLAFQFNRWFSEDFLERNKPEADRIADIFLHTQSQAHAAACRALGSFDMTAELVDIKCPTFVVTGENDVATPVDMGQAIAEGIPDAEFQVVPGAGHLSLVENVDIWPQIKGHL